MIGVSAAPTRPSNMQWQTIADAKGKDRFELGRAVPPADALIFSNTCPTSCYD
jgi:hypothetical protein